MPNSSSNPLTKYGVEARVKIELPSEKQNPVFNIWNNSQNIVEKHMCYQNMKATSKLE